MRPPYQRNEHLPADRPPQDLGRGAEVNGPVGGLGVHPLVTEPSVFHLLAHESAGDGDLLAPHHHHSLPIEQLLRDDGREAPKHVVARIDHHSPRAEARPGHHLSSLPSPAAAAGRGERRAG